MRSDWDDKREALAYNLAAQVPRELNLLQRAKYSRIDAEYWIGEAIKCWNPAYHGALGRHVRNDIVGRLMEQRAAQPYGFIILMWIFQGFVVALVGVLVRWWLEDRDARHGMLLRMANSRAGSASGIEDTT